jgi:hypothetical protein
MHDRKETPTGVAGQVQQRLKVPANASKGVQGAVNVNLRLHHLQPPAWSYSLYPGCNRTRKALQGMF